MFGLSITKILFTALVIVIVWKGFGLVGRLARERDARPARPRQSAGGGRGGGTVELTECPRCGAYFDPQQGCRCGRS